MTKANRPNCYFESKHRLQRRLREKQLLSQNRKPKVEISCEPLKEDERDIAEGGDVEEILKYIENEEENQDSKVMDPKKAAKKARQKQRKLEEKQREDEEQSQSTLTSHGSSVLNPIFPCQECGSNTGTNTYHHLPHHHPGAAPSNCFYYYPPIHPAMYDGCIPPYPQYGRTAPYSSYAYPSALPSSCYPWSPMPENSMTPSNPLYSEAQMQENASSEESVNFSSKIDSRSSGMAALMEGIAKRSGNNRSQVLTIRRLMQPNNADPTVTISVKGENPEQEKVLFTLQNGQVVHGSSDVGDNGKKRKKKKKKKKLPTDGAVLGEEQFSDFPVEDDAGNATQAAEDSVMESCTPQSVDDATSSSDLIAVQNMGHEGQMEQEKDSSYSPGISEDVEQTLRHFCAPVSSTSWFTLAHLVDEKLKQEGVEVQLKETLELGAEPVRSGRATEWMQSSVALDICSVLGSASKVVKNCLEERSISTAVALMEEAIQSKVLHGGKVIQAWLQKVGEYAKACRSSWKDLTSHSQSLSLKQVSKLIVILTTLLTHIMFLMKLFCSCMPPTSNGDENEALQLLENFRRLSLKQELKDDPVKNCLCCDCKSDHGDHTHSTLSQYTDKLLLCFGELNLDATVALHRLNEHTREWIEQFSGEDLFELVEDGPFAVTMSMETLVQDGANCLVFGFLMKEVLRLVILVESHIEEEDMLGYSHVQTCDSSVIENGEKNFIEDLPLDTQDPFLATESSPGAALTQLTSLSCNSPVSEKNSTSGIGCPPDSTDTFVSTNKEQVGKERGAMTSSVSSEKETKKDRKKKSHNQPQFSDDDVIQTFVKNFNISPDITITRVTNKSSVRLKKEPSLGSFGSPPPLQKEPPHSLPQQSPSNVIVVDTNQRKPGMPLTPSMPSSLPFHMPPRNGTSSLIPPPLPPPQCVPWYPGNMCPPVPTSQHPGPPNLSPYCFPHQSSAPTSTSITGYHNHMLTSNQFLHKQSCAVNEDKQAKSKKEKKKMKKGASSDELSVDECKSSVKIGGSSCALCAGAACSAYSNMCLPCHTPTNCSTCQTPIDYKSNDQQNPSHGMQEGQNKKNDQQNKNQCKKKPQKQRCNGEKENSGEDKGASKTVKITMNGFVNDHHPPHSHYHHHLSHLRQHCHHPMPCCYRQTVPMLNANGISGPSPKICSMHGSMNQDQGEECDEHNLSPSGSDDSKNPCFPQKVGAKFSEPKPSKTGCGTAPIEAGKNNKDTNPAGNKIKKTSKKKGKSQMSNQRGNGTFSPDTEKVIEALSVLDKTCLDFGITGTCSEGGKKKNRKKKGRGSDDLSENVFAPKNVDLEDETLDETEKELEAFKRFCLNSVPLERKEKVNLNIKDIFVKKKSTSPPS
ncbi:unnamed protein product [Darwinula stevensoni]|uniref:FAM193 C-terminal domain-containing protein n=1 Tax=Darwinula stevensoni TaxID=69355 RepID=A0A7R8WXG8_9CRUS|nr:unnamed protein product [Darwinula stevensoni]CAG0878498.1 unnamed protein product [Darwinula stevensoni]